MRRICQHRLSGQMGLTLILAATLSACGGSSGTQSSTVLPEDFLSRTLPSADTPFGDGSPFGWNYIWGCEVRTFEGNYSTVPMRFYRDGQYMAGIGTSAVLGTWEFDSPARPGPQPTFTLTIFDAAPQLFGSDSKRFRFNVMRADDIFMESNSDHIFGPYLYGIPASEDATDFGLGCVRYNGAGQVEGDDLPGWLETDERTPSFIITGEASLQFTPRIRSPWDFDQVTETTPAPNQPTTEQPKPEQPTSDPVTSPPTATPPPATQPTTTAPLAAINGQVKNIWYIGDLVDDYIDSILGVSSVYSSVVEFNNGEVSRDAETISNEGIAASKRKNPQDWGDSRIRNGLISYQWSQSRSWDEPWVSTPVRAYPRNFKMKGCFENATGVKGPGTTPRVRRLCLFFDGSFNLGSTGVTGTYLIEDRAIRLNFASGGRAEFLFGADYDDEGYLRLLIIGGRLFYARINSLL